MKTTLFTGTHGHELAAIACKLAKDTDILFGNIAARNQSHTEQIADPFRILLVILIAFNSRNLFGVSDDNMDRNFKSISDGNQIFTCAFHTNILAIVVKEPLLEFKQAFVESGKAFRHVLGRFKTTCDDYGNEKDFVNIDATTDWICEFHKHTPFIIEGKAVAESPHIKLPELKQFLVCGLDGLTYLCLKGDSYTD